MNVANGLKAFGKSFSDFEFVNKILRTLPKSQDPKITTIQEANNLNNFSFEELIRSLMTYEMTCIVYDELEYNLQKNMKDMALRTKEGYLGKNSSDEDDDDNFNTPYKKV